MFTKEEVEALRPILGHLRTNHEIPVRILTPDAEPDVIQDSGTVHSLIGMDASGMTDKNLTMSGRP